MITYTNTSSIPLSLAVFLATDTYDHNTDISSISTTALIKPLRQLILSKRVPDADAAVDITQMVASRMGTAIHDAIERAWTNNYENALSVLGYPEHIIKRIQINPKSEELKDDSFPIYMEQRAYKTVGKFVVSGKFDFVGEGRVEDFKSTSTYTAMHSTNDEKYILQGSIYRWLNPKIITKDEMAIQFIFTDWSAAKARIDPTYPQQRIQQRLLPLKSVDETDHYVKQKLSQITQYWDADEDQLPHCSDEDLWRSVPVFKYYKNADKTSRSTKNFDSLHDARLRFIEDGNVGFIKEVPGQVTACKYCAAFSVCSQKDALIAQGDLIL